MSKVILCTGRKAKNPYTFISTGMSVYTIEELCYHIYHNIDAIGEDLLRHEIVDFMIDELGLSDRGKFVESLLEKNASLKEVVVCILCSCDYLVEKEIHFVMNELDKLDNMSEIGKRKRHGDYFLKHGLLKEAYEEYQSILLSKTHIDLTNDEYASILHNMAYINVKNGFFLKAASGFLEAFECNKQKESLKQYIYALKLSKQESMYNNALRTIMADHSFFDEIENEIYFVNEGVENSTDYLELSRLKNLYERGDVVEYEQTIDQMIERLKVKYRQSI